MTPPPHRLPERDLVALARGGAGTPTVRRLVAARRSRTLLLIRLIAHLAADPYTEPAYRLLSRIHRVAPAACARVLDHPPVGAWATRTAQRLGQGLPADPAELAFVAAAAAVRARLTTTVPCPPRAAISLPSLGVVPRPASGEVPVRCTPDAVEVAGAALHRDWAPLPSIAVESGGLRAEFLLEHWEPDVPEREAPVLDGVGLPAWRTLIAAGWEILARAHREAAQELAATVTVLTPLRPPASGMSSATAADAFGCVFLSLAPDPESVAVTLAHELQHNKLVALMDLFPLLEPAPGKTFYAPWRDDPRPLPGLLHGTYAFTGVTAFWRRQRHATPSSRATMEFARWRAGAREAAGTLLDSGHLTPIGRTFVSAMAEALTEWCAEPIPPRIAAEASRLANEHRAEWVARSRP
ncbi:MAG TPA: HEXXH motif domain-containing protein [Actinophytocola sp.]|uniref:HEXXH motif domain-containing protein n=1 Tax=Actinophytocola sp. TaxID=1872138 RepID=UPI002DDCE252|nr:HEXXH motif domain-containing protein [Actinophytocola sp.]HEV2783685.1 HEXXH motif domain-containing protein [Actinophytocola sp.]